MKTHLLIVDPQNSFCDPSGELFVKGAPEDMTRLARFIGRNAGAIDRISVTLDSHNRVDIAHPAWWLDENGNHPDPFTQITHEDLQAGRWRAASPSDQVWSESYIRKASPHVIWPCHCLMGTWGHQVVPELAEALNRWVEKNPYLDFIPKGSCRYTESFSAVKACVEMPDDPATRLNMSLLIHLDESGTILVAGEASSHCVADTTRDLIRYRESLTGKIILMEDTMSPVPGFEKDADAFLNDMKNAGVTIETCERIDERLQR